LDALPPDQDLIGYRILAMENLSAEEIGRRLEDLIPAENFACIRARAGNNQREQSTAD